MDSVADSKCREEKIPAGGCPSLVSLLALFESVPALLWETDAQLRLTCLNGAALHSVGIAAGRYAGKEVASLFPSAGAAIHAHERALTGEAGSFEVDLNGRDLRASVRPLRAAGGEIEGVLGIAIDMTERLVAERALRLSEHSFRSLIEHAPYGICRSTIAGELLQVNQAMVEMLGYDTSPELLLRDLPLIFSSPTFEAFQKAVLSTGSSPAADGTWTRRDGQAIQVRLSGRLVRRHSGEASHLDIFAEDVTEKRRLEDELNQAQRMQAVGQLAGGVAHDFNNLLTVIAGHVELMLGQSPDPAFRERLEAVKRASEKAASLTRQLLALSRRQVLRTRVVNLNEVIGQLMGMLGRLIKENVELVFEAGEGLGSVKADPNEIERVLMNLAVNAQDAMPAGGRLTIATVNVLVADPLELPDLPKGDYVRIDVRDTGIGMDRETQARAFEPFFTTKPGHEGTGLGLAVVYGVVRQSGGYIRLASEPGLGTTFQVYLPRVAASAVSLAERPGIELLPGGSETILFAEDDEAIRRFVSEALVSLGYRVLSAPDGAAALSMGATAPGGIHLLLTDLVMPGMGGRELAARLVLVDPDLKVVFMSGYAGPSAAEQELELPGVAFLQKPFSISLLASTVRATLDQPASQTG